MVGVSAAAVTLGGVAPAHADAAGVTAPAAVPVHGTYRENDMLTADVAAIVWGGTPANR